MQKRKALCPTCKKVWYCSCNTLPDDKGIYICRCPECYEEYKKQIKAATSIPGKNETPRPATFYKSYHETPKPMKRKKTRAPLLTKSQRRQVMIGNRVGMLVSQPDGLTWRQRAATKSVS